MVDHNPILVTGATGYVGGRLVEQLLENDVTVRVLVRDARRLQGRPWLSRVEVSEGDVLQPTTLQPALDGVQTAYYLIHSMIGHGDFHARDMLAARNFGTAAAQAGLQRLIYLGGLGDSNSPLSDHLRSRQQTGDVLRASGIPVTEFRAAVIVGSGSLSFEMIRYLSERLPVMICPHWVYTRIQPIAIRDVLAYLAGALEQPESAGQIIEIGGADIQTYAEMMLGYARARGLQRFLLPVPVLTPRLSSYWVHLVTPIPASLSRPLIDGLRNEVVVRDHRAHKLFPAIQPMAYQTAVQLALDSLEQGRVKTAWSDALFTTQRDIPPVMLTNQEGIISETRQLVVRATPEQVYRTFASLGGQRGWLFYNWAWHLRGWLDRLIGGVGMRRGRRDAHELRVGDPVDFWRVEEVQPNRLIRLRAEMTLPGRGWLQFEAIPTEHGSTRLIQTAFFVPDGLFGLLYWSVLYPAHGLIFAGMSKRIAEAAERLASSPLTSNQSSFTHG
ncbi:MAG: SDR family oxidoreductase [Chloroflexaceae bacterium]|nr:SDR family oxidoreductase [Chloroflexaceae bacterium]